MPNLYCTCLNDALVLKKSEDKLVNALLRIQSIKLSLTTMWYTLGAISIFKPARTITLYHSVVELVALFHCIIFVIVLFHATFNWECGYP